MTTIMDLSKIRDESGLLKRLDESIFIRPQGYPIDTKQVRFNRISKKVRRLLPRGNAFRRMDIIEAHAELCRFFL
jgi:hypothetical protein